MDRNPDGELGRRADGTGQRVVFIPGILGTTLIDSSLSPDQAQQECVRNMGRLGRLLRGTPLYPCDKRPETLWGGVGSLHWLFNPAGWERRMNSGNGLDSPGAIRPTQLFEVDVRFGRLRLQFRPYADFLRVLRRAGHDVLAFTYDWRLSARANVEHLHQQIRRKWFDRELGARSGTSSERAKVTLIGHSMGGLLARLFVEGSKTRRELVQCVITIGTPHLGCPQAYLHFAGITFPFPENPFYRDVPRLLQAQLSAAGMAAQGGIASQVLPGRTQTAVFKHMASAIELMPIYDFVTVQGRREAYSDTYRGEVHTGTRTPASSIIEAFRQRMVQERQLGPWLSKHRVDYHFVAVTGLTTASGYERPGQRILTTRDGDGTVPLSSATVTRRSSPKLHVMAFSGGPYGHQRLCERRDVQDYCLQALTAGAGSRAAPRHVPATADHVARVRRAPQHQPLTADYVAMARRILQRAPRSRGLVLTVTHLVADDGKPLVRTEIDPPAGGSKRPRLRYPPLHLSSPELHEVESPRHGTFQYAWMLPHTDARFPVGGIMFVPKRFGSAVGEPVDLHLVTFNVGPLDVRHRSRCKNAHHAEVQMTNWIDQQLAIWRMRIGTIKLANRARWGDSRGYSPCTSCCADLANFLRNLNALRRGRRIVASISWQELYDRGEVCGHPTDARCIGRLRDSGWGEPQGPRPSGARSLPTPVPVPRSVATPRPPPSRAFTR